MLTIFLKKLKASLDLFKQFRLCIGRKWKALGIQIMGKQNLVLCVYENEANFRIKHANILDILFSGNLHQ